MTTPPLPTGIVTFLFTDVEGSTRLVQQLGADAYGEVMTRQREAIRAAASLHGGVEFGTEGDAVFLAFAQPRQAVLAAADAQRALGAERGPSTVRVRMAVHTGEAHTVDDNYIGLPLHVVARLCSAGHGGQVLVSDATRHLAIQEQTVELGSHRLRDIAEPMLIHQLVVDDVQEFPPLRTRKRNAHNLPTATDAFIGRSTETIEVAEAVLEHRIVTLVGAGGSGKTRLAVEVATGMISSFADGVWLVELATATSGHLVAPYTAGVLKVGERSTSGLEDTLAEQLAEKQMLLVLDNCEHVLDDVARVVDRLVRSCPRVAVLMTSRELVGVRGERAIPLRPLSLASTSGTSEAVELFLTRMAAAAPTVQPDADRGLVEQVCRRLDGLPLAIELAASRLRTMSLEQLVSRLDDRFRVLTGGSRTELGRQRTLEAVVGWSYDLLSENEQDLFRRISVFADSFSMEGAEAVADADDVFDLVLALADKSLLIVSGDVTPYRYQMLETVRQFGRDRLREHTDSDATRRRLLDWTLKWVDQLETDMRSPRQDATIAAVITEGANVRAAMEWALEHDERYAALRIASAAPVMLNGERRQLIQRLLASLDDLPTDFRAEASMTLAQLAFEQSDFRDCLTFAQAAADGFTKVGEQRRALWAEFFVATGTWGLGDTAEAKRLVRRLLEGNRERGADFGLAYALWIASQHEEDLEVADDLAAESEQLFRTVGSPMGLAHDLEGRALIALRAGAPERVPRPLVEAIGIFASADNLGCTAHCLETTAAWLSTHEQFNDAATLLGAADELRRKSGQGHRPWEWQGSELSAAAMRQQQEATTAEAHAEGARLSLAEAASRAQGMLGDRLTAG